MPEHPEYADHFGPEGLRVRGTVVVVPGRGETPAAYRRLGARLAADAYRVRVVAAPDLDADDLTGSLTRFAARLTEAVDSVAAVDGGERSDTGGAAGGIVRPLVLLGSDTGAAALAALLGPGRSDGTVPAADAVVLAGLPGRATAAAGTWEDELDARTSCPAHRRTLTDDTGVRRGALNDTVPEALLTAVHDGGPAVPTLILAGDADPLADHDALHRTVKSLPRARLSVVRGAHHDVLNDLQHRSVAAEIVTFLETLREDLVPVVSVAASAW
ncbi:alpha/beta hydrolase [Streptomyces mangrovisoli]|uniref:Alpha/beta hydrolase n=1 Tax=Streptomyces mangrovisoli TaxID=1428628 RepID=A0A1J4P044_9ACTN|nr:alpha/beta hydrolase [Streptomyces mangrovisoli]OIJ68105.1 alpha/beta hydrolase [Streptomyces mangrovisoli]